MTVSQCPLSKKPSSQHSKTFQSPKWPILNGKQLFETVLFLPLELPQGGESVTRAIPDFDSRGDPGTRIWRRMTSTRVVRPSWLAGQLADSPTARVPCAPNGGSSISAVARGGLNRLRENCDSILC